MSRPRRRGRDIHGVLLLDKPQGMSSNDVLQKSTRTMCRSATWARADRLLFAVSAMRANSQYVGLKKTSQ